MGCSHCGGNEIEYDSAAGMSYCTGCGQVQEESTIVAEVTFGEAASGAAIVQGSYVRAGQTRASMGGPGRFGDGQESREITLFNSRRRLQRLATALNLSEHYIDSAQRYFTLALNLNFTRGRRSVYVSTACLYIVCRQEKGSQMLIDFTDILQVSLFKLGATFVKLVRLLNLTLPLVDPSLYISRFASMLEFGDKTQQVCADAARIVARMNRDWIRIGRRPAGICGAGLLIAARMNNFRRTQREIIRVIKISDGTLRRRLEEFSNTPSGNLTVSDFRGLELGQCEDPPSFTRNREKARKALAEQRNQNEGVHARILKRLRPDDDQEYEDAGEDVEEDSVELDEGDAKDMVDNAMKDEFSRYLAEASLNLVSISTAKDDFSADVSTWSDIDDDEVANIMLNDDEVKSKTDIWDRENKEFMEERELKRKAKEAETSGRKRRRSTKKKVVVPGATPLESAQNVLAMRRLSKKINYDVLGKLLDTSNAPRAQTEHLHSTMLPSAAPSRMISVAGTPALRSGYASPSQETFFSQTQGSTGDISGLPAALAGIAGKKVSISEHTETIVYEEGEHDVDSTAVNLAQVAEEEDDEEDEEYDAPYEMGGYASEEPVEDDGY
ncbi:transcription factor TFIIIB subunit brf1 [Coemansia interrupta]|uniref:B-related factor 1 n=1 Tax=Coemansia interrupta TaxID=1126814 RepID=A0A9W8LPS3_9FUNG|nr:transcription factor TFIIIB subunit brf1 [Coemansia interrupta]